MAEFITPSFLQNCSTEDMHKRMADILPADIDLSAGGHGWNMTYPTALVAAFLCEFILPEVIKLAFPEWSYDEFLDGHAKARSITRRAATAATGELTITGAADILIPEGSLFSTASVNDIPSVDYRTTETVTIPASGSISVPIACTETGIIGNTGANTIVLVGGKIIGITAVTNPEAVTGGTEAEDDETLIQRITDYDQSQGDSFTGSPADYKRWAMSVPGVGEATVIPAQDDTGLVTIIVTDANGEAATDTLCDSVYNYIMKPDDKGARLAPVNANLSVVPPATISIGIRATVELTGSATIESVREAFAKNVALYLPIAMDEEEIKHTRIASVLSATAGVNDYSNLEIGQKTGGTITWGTANIPITTTQLPTVTLDDLILTAGTV